MAHVACPSRQPASGLSGEMDLEDTEMKHLILTVAWLAFTFCCAAFVVPEAKGVAVWTAGTIVSTVVFLLLD